MRAETPWEPDTPDEELPQDPGIPGPRAPDELPEEEPAGPGEPETTEAPPKRGLLTVA